MANQHEQGEATPHRYRVEATLGEGLAADRASQGRRDERASQGVPTGDASSAAGLGRPSPAHCRSGQKKLNQLPISKNREFNCNRHFAWSSWPGESRYIVIQIPWIYSVLNFRNVIVLIIMIVFGIKFCMKRLKFFSYDIWNVFRLCAAL